MLDFMLMADISIGAINSDNFWWQVMLKTLNVKIFAYAPGATLLIFGIVITAKCEFREFHLLPRSFLRISTRRDVEIHRLLLVTH